MAEHVKPAAPAPAPNPLVQLVELTHRARHAASPEELAFLAVNDSHALFAYRQAALWFAGSGVEALSGVVEPEANAPYVQWLQQTCAFLRTAHASAATVEAIQLPQTLAEEWAEWLPAYALWLPFGGRDERDAPGGLLLAAEQPWPEEALILLEEWVDAWHHAWSAATRAGWSWRGLRQGAARLLAAKPKTPWWKQPRLRVALVVLAVLLIPVRLSVLAPGELVPSDPAVIRAPVDGVIGQFHVQPNQPVKAGQLLFNFDEASLAARRDVAVQTLATAEAQYRQAAQQALNDPRSKAQLAPLLGEIAEKRAESDYVEDQFARSRVTAPRDGIALFDDPSEWVGRPVQVGERIMRIAAPGDVEVEAWLPIGDAIPLPADASVSLYLAANPLSPVQAKIRYVAHDAVPRPDGSYAYRVRARLLAPTAQRVGLKGTAKFSGPRVPLIYWILRRPLATIRQTLGI